MWTTEHATTTDVSAAALWQALVDLHHGVPLGERSDTFELLGPFAVGTEVLVTPAGQDTMRSVITELEPGRSYADATAYGDLVLTFRHGLETLAGGGTRIVHTLTIDGPGADAVGPELGPQISGDFPEAMDELVAAARARQAPVAVI